MGLFDLFKPKWRHSDAQVRAEAVKQLSSGDDAALLQRIARGDGDPRVRRIALKKIDDWQTLSAVAEDDPDESLRRDAGDRAAELLVETATGANEAAAQDALGRMKSQRAIAEVAQRAQLASLRRAALERVSEPKPLAEIARKSSDVQVRRVAVAQITDPAVLREVAITDENKEVALAACQRIADRAALQQVVQRAKQWKAVRALAKEKLDALTAGDTGTGPQTEKRRRARQAQLCRVVEAASASDEWERAEDEIQDARAEWRQLGDAEESLTRRFERAIARFQARLSERAAELRREVEAARVKEPPAAVGESEREQKDREQREHHEQTTAREPDPEQVRRDQERAQERAQREAEKEADRARKDAETSDNLARLIDIATQLEGMASTEDRKRGEKALKDAQSVVQGLGPLPQAKQAEARARYQAARGQLHIRVQELRDAEDWKRWANVPRLEALCARMEALLTVEDLQQVAQDLKTLQSEWKEVGPAPKDKQELLWARFKASGDQVYERVKAIKQAAIAERSQNLQRKEELCARAEALVDSSEWKETADTLKALQEEWKAIGAVPREQADAVWQRFRGACDKFFERRKAHFAVLDEERQRNLTKQEALCARVETLAGSDDFRGAADQIKDAQAEWKEIGPAPKEQADAVWQRFRGACDKFFERRKAHFAVLDEERVKNLKAKEELCAAAEALAKENDKGKVATRLNELEAEWEKLGPVPREQVDAIEGRFRTAGDQAMARKTKPGEAPRPSPKFENKLPLEALIKKLPPESDPKPAPPSVASQIADTDAGWTALADEAPKDKA